LVLEGWKPDRAVPAGEILATVRQRDYRQHVDVGTWQAMHLMAELPVLGEVKAGNPPIRLGSPMPADGPSGNGILNQARGSFVADACGILPSPRGAAQDEEATVDMEVPDLGLVRFTFQANTYRHGRSRHWHWKAVRAELAQPGELDGD
jgi:hypothetical protein